MLDKFILKASEDFRFYDSVEQWEIPIDPFINESTKGSSQYEVDVTSPVKVIASLKKVVLNRS